MKSTLHQVKYIDLEMEGEVHVIYIYVGYVSLEYTKISKYREFIMEVLWEFNLIFTMYIWK